MPKNSAVRRYLLRFLSVTLLYVVFLVLAVWEFSHRHPTGFPAYMLAVLPSLPIIAGLVVVGLYLAEEKDEFQRMVQIQSMLWSIGATLAVTTVWGFLENFVHVQHFDLYLVYPLFWLFVGIFTPVMQLRYR
jgi:hypothetical protein